MRKRGMVSLSCDGRRYEYETTGNSLFEIAARGLVHFVQNGYLLPSRFADTELQVQIETLHRLKVDRVHHWLGEPVDNDFRLHLIKQQIWRDLTRRS